MPWERMPAGQELKTLISDFDYRLPDDLIAQEALTERSEAKLLVIERSAGRVEHGNRFKSLPGFLKKGDVLLLNNTRVIPARITGVKKETGGKIELLLLKQNSEKEWEVLAKPSRRVRAGSLINFGDEITAEPAEELGEGRWTVKFSYEGDFLAILEKIGAPPLPPYIRTTFEKEKLSKRYQTVYARIPGAAAAPTAGLHFTEELLKKIEEMGVSIAPLTIHAGLGTFRPVKGEFIEDHRMDSEYYEIGEDTAAIVNNRPPGGRIFAVGTTSVRVIETVADEGGVVHPGRGWTDIFMYPGYRFKAVDALITNFHPPRSTTLLLAAAFAGKDLLLKAYAEAVSRKYRFLTFGDATLII